MAAMKTDLIVLAGTVLLLMAAPAVSHAEPDDDWATRSPLALGEPMDDCDIHHHDVVIAIQPAPALAADKVEAILATPDVVPAVAPIATPAAIAPAKAPPESTTQAAPRHLSPAALLTFALIASPGTAMPQTGAMSGTRD
jgi:hypothetical protein